MTFPWQTSAADRRLLGIRPLSGPTPWVVAIMSFSIMLVASAGLALANSAALFAGAVEQRYSVEIPASSDRSAQLLKALREAPAVSDADLVSEREMRGSLRRWLGPLAESDDLPVPNLITFNLTPGASPASVSNVVNHVEPAAVIQGFSARAAPILRSLRALQWTALTLVLLLAAAAAVIMLAARAALDTHRSTIEILHGVGATDRQITLLLQRKIALDSLVGSIAGAAASATVLALLAAGSAFLGELGGGATLGAGDLALLAMIPFALTGLAAFVARSAVVARLRESL